MYDNPEHCRHCLAEFRERYNNRRPHWALIPEEGGDSLTPQEVYIEARIFCALIAQPVTRQESQIRTAPDTPRELSKQETRKNNKTLDK